MGMPLDLSLRKKVSTVEVGGGWQVAVFGIFPDTKLQGRKRRETC